MSKMAIFLTEEDLKDHHLLADVISDRATAAGLTVRSRRGIEGFGRNRHLRSERLVDLARGLPIVLEVEGPSVGLDAFSSAIAGMTRGIFMTRDLD